MRSLKVLVLVVSACGGAIDAPPAPLPYTVLQSLDEPCGGDPKLTGRSVVSRMKDSYTSNKFGAANATTPTTVTITMAYQNGELRCYSTPHLEVVFQTKVVTKDGYLAEAFTSTVHDSSVAGEDRLELEARIPVANIKGSYRPTLTGNAWESHDLTFSIGFNPWGTAGSVVEEGKHLGQEGIDVAGVGGWY